MAHEPVNVSAYFCLICELSVEKFLICPLPVCALESSLMVLFVA